MGDIERLVAEADDGTVDDEFLRLLAKGGELLTSGRVAEAKDILERAFRLQPKNPKAQNLLGLACFKLNILDRAAEIYEMLVRDNPVDPTLRVNLGLVYLKQSTLERAIREFETAVDLAPDHKKAQNYLGLALAQTGDYARAKDCFVAAGSLTMAEKMEKALKDPSEAPKVLNEGAKGAKADEKGPGELEVEIEVESASAPVTAPPDAAPAQPAPVYQPPPAAPAESGPVPGGGSVATIAELVRNAVLPMPHVGESFEVAGEAVLVRVQGEVLSRLEGLLAASGALQYVPEMKRFRGKATDKDFGEGERRIVRVSGNGLLHLARRGRQFVVVELGEESVYFREEAVFAFEETLVFENGRVPSKVAPDLHLVHLRGKGKVLLDLPSPLQTAPATGGIPVAVPFAALVGWQGSLTPKITGLPDEQEGTAVTAVVQLTGEGYALLVGPKV